MEEADALCSRIGIMAGGSLRAIGTQLYLKSRFGDGFKVTLNCVDESMERLRRVNDFVTSLSADAKFVSRFGAHLTYTVSAAAPFASSARSSKQRLHRYPWPVATSQRYSIGWKAASASW